MDTTILDYFGNSDICLGTVKKADANRSTVETASGGTAHVTEKQIIARYISSQSGKAALADIINRIQETMDGIDLDLLWDDVNSESIKYGVGDLAERYFGECQPLQASAMARKLCSDTLRFQRMGQEFLVRTPEMVEEQKAILKARAERAAMKEKRAAWLAQVVAHSMDKGILPVPPEMEDFVGLCRDYLILGFNSDAVNLLAALKSKATVRELALSVLKKTDRLPKDADEFLLVNGIHAGFAPAAVEAADKLVKEATARPDHIRRKDLTGLHVFSIDDQWTQEVDDALSIDAEGDGWCVGIHISNPAEFVHKGDVLDEVAIERPLSLYLPTTTVTMFPEALGCNLASLSQSEDRPALTFLAHFDRNLDLDDWEIVPSKIRVKRRLTYIEADSMLARGNSDITADALHQMNKIAHALAKIREDNECVNLNRPEIKVIVSNGEVNIYPEDQETESRHLVREFMILANHLAAKFALRNDIPIIYRCQDASSEPVHSVVNYNPVDFDQQVRKMKRTRLSTYPQEHFGLGLDLYTQISSPLRRYADLVIQRQIIAFITGKPMPYTQEELFGVLDNAERTASQHKALEREAHRYWILEYLRRNCIGEITTATIVRLEGNLVLAELNKYYERGVVMTRESLKVGQVVKVRIAEVKPQLARMSLELA